MKYLLFVAGAVACVLALGVATSWFGLVTSRPMQQYAEDTRRLTFERSRAHQSGVNAGIVEYCLNMRQATDEAQKKAVARFIVSEAATFYGTMNNEAAACVSEAQAAL